MIQMRANFMAKAFRTGEIGAVSKHNPSPTESGESLPVRAILPVTPLADARARRYEQTIRFLKRRESAHIIDNKSGLPVFPRIHGQRDRISFTGEQLESMWGRVLTHNHPDGWGYPETDPRHGGVGFSVTDARFLVDWGLTEIRAVTPKFLYRLRPPADPDARFNRLVMASDTRSWRDSVHRAFEDAEVEILEGIATKEIMEEAFPVLLSHWAMIKLSQEWDVEYEREDLP